MDRVPNIFKMSNIDKLNRSSGVRVAITIQPFIMFSNTPQGIIGDAGVIMTIATSDDIHIEIIFTHGVIFIALQKAWETSIRNLLKKACNLLSPSAKNSFC